MQSIKTVLAAASQEHIDSASWNSGSLFSNDNQDLQGMMGVLLKVPELRENLKAVTGGQSPDGRKLALIVKDWVNGVSVSEIASRYFMDEGDDITKAMTACGRNLFGRLTQTASWGLGALLSITGTGLTEEQLRTISNLPSRVYYGVNDDAAIGLRLLGVPRAAATPLARAMGKYLGAATYRGQRPPQGAGRNRMDAGSRTARGQDLSKSMARTGRIGVGCRCIHVLVSQGEEEGRHTQK